MKNFVTLILFSITFLFSVVSNVHAQATILEDVTISAIKQYDNGYGIANGTYIQIAETMVNPDNCDSSGWYLVFANVALLKEAASQNRNVNLALLGCSLSKSVYDYVTRERVEFPTLGSPEVISVVIKY